MLHGITINGLTIADGDVNLAEYYRRRVIGGQEAFIIFVTRKEGFAHPKRQKIKRELMLLADDEGYPPTRPDLFSTPEPLIWPQGTGAKAGAQAAP